VVTVARSVLAEKGFHGTTMTDIAEAAGVTKPVLYQHFSSKRELYRTVLEDVGDRMASTVLASASAAQTPRARATAGIEAYATFVEEEREGFEILFHGSNRQDPEWARIISGVERSLAQAIGSLIDVPSIDPRRRQVMAYGVIGLVEAMMRHGGRRSANRSTEGGDAVGREPADDPDHRRRLIDDTVQLVWAGLRGLES
jgi:AcrR family transcriptional regulator